MKDGLVPAANAWPAGWPAGRSFVFEQAELVVSTLTVQCKVRSPAWAWLDQAAREVNQVWNFCNATSFKAAYGRYGGSKRWLSGFDMNKLLAGVGDCFEKIGIDVAQAVAAEHATRRNQFKTSKLRFRKSGGSRKSLGWVPFKGINLRFKVSKKDPSQIKVCFYGKTIGLFNAERLLRFVRLANQGVGKLKAGSFSQDSLGHWYLNVAVDQVEAALPPLLGADSSVGLDPGQVKAMTGSSGEVLGTRRYRTLEPKIQQAQKCGHKKQARRYHRKARRQRQDDQNKFCRAVVNDHGRIWIGDLAYRRMIEKGLKGQAKSLTDAAIGAAYTKLTAMGHRAGRVVEKVSEKNSTRRCSSCQALTGPAGLISCDVRQWVCSACGADHDRDRNSGENLRHVGETEWQNRSSSDRAKAVAPRCWRPFAGTR